MKAISKTTVHPESSVRINENGEVNEVSRGIRLNQSRNDSKHIRDSGRQHESLVFLSESNSILVGEQRTGDVYEYDFSRGILGSERRILETGVNDLRDLTLVTQDDSEVQYLAALHGKSAVINGEKNDQGIAYIQLDLESGEIQKSDSSVGISKTWRARRSPTMSSYNDNGSSQEGALFKISFSDLLEDYNGAEQVPFSEYTTGHGSRIYRDFQPNVIHHWAEQLRASTISNNTTTWGVYEFWNEFSEGATIESGDVYLIVDPGSDPAIIDQVDYLFEHLGDGDDSLRWFKEIRRRTQSLTGLAILTTEGHGMWQDI